MASIAVCVCHAGKPPGVECRNPFCMHWEPAQDNTGGQICQDASRELGEDGLAEMECACVPGVTIPCFAGRCHRTLEEDRDVFLTRFRAIRDERDANNKRTKRFDRCPFEDCNQEIIRVNSLGDCFSDANIALLVKHMNSSHGMDMTAP
jgi:hypothetical protein